MSIDPRRFDYPLQPLLQRRQWQLDTSRARLGRLQRNVTAAELDLGALRAQHAQQSQDVARALQLRLDPHHHAQSLQWLRQLKERIEAGVADLAARRLERDAMAAQCIAQQQKVDAVQAHREDVLHDFTREEGARLATQADKDWLTRLHTVASRAVDAHEVRP